MTTFRKIRLLVVEDNAAFLYLIQKAFADRNEKIRWELITAQDGQAALDVLFEEEVDSDPLPDLILLDWNLPKVTGSEVLRRVKDTEAAQNSGSRVLLIWSRWGHPFRLR
jgi:chemotaxis family two-component system response regulator Rcp1